MPYKTNRDKIKDFLELKILPILRKKDLDYYKVVDVTVAELGISKNMVEETLNGYLTTGKIKEERILTVTEVQLSEILKEMKEAEKEAEQILSEGKNA